MLGSADLESPVRRGALTAVVVLGGLAIHLAVQRSAPPPLLRLDGGLVAMTPFLPWTVWIYLLFFPLLVATGALISPERWIRLVGAWGVASITTWVLVLLVPVTFARPALSALGDSAHGWVLGVVYGIDPAHVTFPCLHAAVIWIAWLALARADRRLRVAFLVLALAITVSTMTTRQHLVTDNVAGLAIAWFSARLLLPGLRETRAAAVTRAETASPET